MKPRIFTVILLFISAYSSSKTWETEKSFIEFLDNHKEVEWWFKNGERDGTYFAVPYKNYQDEDQTFYIDFIVNFKDERIGLFDTKSGWTAKDAGTRSDGMQRYIKEQNKKGKIFFGGIVIPKSGSLYTYTDIPYKHDKQLTDWKILEI